MEAAQTARSPARKSGWSINIANITVAGVAAIVETRNVTVAGHSITVRFGFLSLR